MYYTCNRTFTTNNNNNNYNNNNNNNIVFNNNILFRLQKKKLTQNQISIRILQTFVSNYKHNLNMMIYATNKPNIHEAVKRCIGISESHVVVVGLVEALKC